MNMDRSLAFTALLNLDPNFGKLSMDEGTERVTRLLEFRDRQARDYGITETIWESAERLVAIEASTQRMLDQFSRQAAESDWSF